MPPEIDQLLPLGRRLNVVLKIFDGVIAREIKDQEAPIADGIARAAIHDKEDIGRRADARDLPGRKRTGCRIAIAPAQKGLIERVAADLIGRLPPAAVALRPARE